VALIKWFKSPTAKQNKTNISMPPLTRVNLKKNKPAHHLTSPNCNKTPKNYPLTSRGNKLECSEADVVQSLVIEDHAFVGVFYKLVYREGSVIWLHDGVGNLRRREHRESKHHTVGVLLTYFRDKQSSHTRTSTSSKRVANLKACTNTTWTISQHSMDE